MENIIIIKEKDICNYEIYGFDDLLRALERMNGVEVLKKENEIEIKYDSYELLYKNQKRFAGRKSKKTVSNDELRRLVEKYGYDEVAEILGVSIPTVRSWMEQELSEGESMPKKQNRKYNPKKFDIDIPTLIEEKKSHTYRELAEKYGCSESHLQNLIYEAKKVANND